MARAHRRRPRMKWYRDAILTACFLLLLVLIAARLNGDGGEPVQGPFRVVDGDTLAAGRERFRLTGIDAPELGQTCERDGQSWPCGLEAKLFVKELVAGGDVSCRGNERDRYGRLLVSCEIGNRTLNGAIVGAGMAIATSSMSYRREERQAQQAGAGIWAGSFDRPAEWRRARRLEAEADAGFMNGLRNILSLQWL